MKPVFLGLLTAMIFSGQTAARRSSAPTVAWTTATGYSLAVQGSDWPASDPLAFELSQSSRVYGLELTADASGSFEIGVTNFSCSFGGTAQARDFQGNQAMPPVMDPCGPGGKLVTLTFTVLTGQRINESVTHLTGLGNGKVVTIQQRGVLYLWERGKSSPQIMPSAPSKYFFLVGYGQGKSPTCTGSCAKGFFWRWAGMSPGSTNIDLRPWCGTQVCPEDWVAALRVRIKAPKSAHSG